MADYYAGGIDDMGEYQITGPHGLDPSVAEMEAENQGWRRIRVVEAASREDAERKLRPSRPRPESLLSTDGPATPFDPSNFPQLRGLE